VSASNGKSHDVIVLGAGIVGAGTAYFLARRASASC
jgi:Predicted dehydrogenase